MLVTFFSQFALWFLLFAVVLGIPDEAPPLPPSRSGHHSPSTPPPGQAPALPKRGVPSVRAAKPPPVPNSERPRARRPLTASHSMDISSDAG